MPETSREFVVVLPDDNQFTVPVQPSLQASDLLDMACSHCKIKEKAYFGLMIEEDGYRNWLELDKPVLDPSQEIPKGTDPVKVYLSFKYYVDSYQDLLDYVTVELLYLQSRKGIEKGDIHFDDDSHETVFELSALVMQATNGPFTTDEEATKVLQALPVIPAYIFNQTSIKACEAEVIRFYRIFEKFGRGEAIFRYLEIVQSLPMYSYHYFEVKDKNGVQLWLGVGPGGIIQCPYENRNDPTHHYQWMDLQNIYYKDKKFSVEVYSSNKSPRKGVSYGGGTTVSMQSWYGKNSKVVMAIWKMVRDQHIFYRNKRSKANDISGENEDQKIGMTTGEILRHLNHKHHHGSISPSSSHSSLSIESAKSTATVEAIAAAKKAQQEMYSALVTKREVLLEDLESKLTAYKGLLLKEMQITGVPPEGLTAEEIEKMRTKFSINYKFSKFVLDKNGSMHGGELEDLEKQLEVQQAIIEAQKSLVEQAKGRIKNNRKKEVRRAEEKFQVLEDKLYDLRDRHQRRSFGESRFDSPGFSLPPPHSVTTPNSKHSVRHSSPNSSMLIDDNVIAKMIFDESNHQISPLVSSPKSPLHKTISSLQDVTEIHKPMFPNPITTHRHLSATHSSSPYPSSTSPYLSDSSRSFSAGTGLHNMESHDSYYREYNRSPHGSGTMPAMMRYDDHMHRSSYQEDGYRLPFTPNKSSSPNGTPYHRSSDSGVAFQTHAALTISPHPPGYRNSSPDMYSPNVRSSYPSSFSEPTPNYNYSGQVGSPRIRPHSTHSARGTTPPKASEPYQNQHSSRYTKEKEMGLEEALMMDQDEGTLV